MALVNCLPCNAEIKITGDGSSRSIVVEGARVYFCDKSECVKAFHELSYKEVKKAQKERVEA